MFMSAVVLETTVSTATYYSLLVQYAVFFRVLPYVIAAPVYYAVFFRVRLLLALSLVYTCWYRRHTYDHCLVMISCLVPVQESACSMHVTSSLVAGKMTKKNSRRSCSPTTLSIFQCSICSSHKVVTSRVDPELRATAMLTPMGCTMSF